MTSDLLFQDEIRGVVADAYGALEAGGGAAVAARIYDPEQLADLPDGAVRWALGVGNPVRHAALRPGEVVLDVGSGGGIDSIFAARQVGPAGRVIGVDMLDAMRDRAEAHARAAGVDRWTAFRAGRMESLPIDGGSIDVVISNGAINLSPRKSRVFAEIKRALRPGGRVSLADLVIDEDLPSEILRNDAAWAG